ncbi:MAG: 2-hydroxyacyl-CoA dehydratase family protein [Chloroflexota bacterium]
MKASEQLLELARETPNDAVKRWKQQGKKIVGFFCSYVPEELVHAADLFPFRVKARGCTETPLADSLMAQVNCSFVRACLQLALQGDYKFLDGVVSLNSCDHIRRMYDVWRYRVDTPYHHFLSVPHKVSEEAVAWYRDEVSAFKGNLEKAFGVDITTKRLREAISVYNETRRLLHSLYDLRRSDNPPISGTEVHDIVVAATAMPKEEYNELLTKALQEIGGRKGISGHSARLMVLGSVLDDPSLVSVVEELGGLVVADALCFGSRYFWESVKEVGDPVENLARSYLKRPACPRMATEHPSRMEYIKMMVKDFAVDGIILERIRYCDLWGGVSMVLQKELDEAGIPVLVLDREYILSGVGQIRTRVQAFLEMMG